MHRKQVQQRIREAIAGKGTIIFDKTNFRITVSNAASAASLRKELQFILKELGCIPCNQPPEKTQFNFVTQYNYPVMQSA